MVLGLCKETEGEKDQRKILLSTSLFLSHTHTEKQEIEKKYLNTNTELGYVSLANSNGSALG